MDNPYTTAATQTVDNLLTANGGSDVLCKLALLSAVEAACAERNKSMLEEGNNAYKEAYSDLEANSKLMHNTWIEVRAMPRSKDVKYNPKIELAELKLAEEKRKLDKLKRKFEKDNPDAIKRPPIDPKKKRLFALRLV